MSKKNKKIIRVALPFFAIFILGVVMGGYATLFYDDGSLQPRSSLLSQCTGHAKGNRHFHVKLEITQNGNKIFVPRNIGVNGSCIHPVHTHDTSGTIHIDYPTAIPFTLGDFFDTQGIIFNDQQLGSVKRFDGYIISIKVNGKTISRGYRGIILKDKSTVAIVLERKND